MFNRLLINRILPDRLAPHRFLPMALCPKRQTHKAGRSVIRSHLKLRLYAQTKRVVVEQRSLRVVNEQHRTEQHTTQYQRAGSISRWLLYKTFRFPPDRLWFRASACDQQSVFSPASYPLSHVYHHRQPCADAQGDVCQGRLMFHAVASDSFHRDP